MVLAAKKMIREGRDITHIAAHYRCPVPTIQSLADSMKKPDPEPSQEADPLPGEETEEEPTEENTAPDPVLSEVPPPAPAA